MRIITGAILIVGAIWLFTSALPYGNVYGGMPEMVRLAFILAGLTAILGLFYLFVGSVEAKESSRWYQFTIKSLLAITVMVALFFSGRALGLHEALTPYPSPAAYLAPLVSPAIPSSSWVAPGPDPFASPPPPPVVTYGLGNQEPVQSVPDSEKTQTQPNPSLTPNPK